MSTSNNYGFNTLFNSQLPKREQRALLRRIAIAACCGVLALILILSISMAIYTAFSGPSDPDNKPGNRNDVDYKPESFNQDDIKFGSLVLVNDANPYTVPTDTAHLSSIYDISRGKPYSYAAISADMEGNALAAMDAMLVEQYSVNNVTITVRKAYPNDKATTATTPNEFYTGLVVELKLIDNKQGTYNLADDQIVYNWFKENAYRFGFIMYAAEEEAQTGIPGTSNYFRYIGVAHTTYIHEHNVKNPAATINNLEAYLNALPQRDQENPLEIEGADGNKYLVYYTSAGDSIQLPKNFEFEKSGDNKNGVIITINLNKPITTEAQTESESESVTETTPAAASDEA